MGVGAKIWEMTHKKQVMKERELTKGTTPAGEDRSIEKEDKTSRRKTLEKQIKDAGG